MDPFVRRLVERLFDPAQPLSRNRHFHTFDNAEGRRALRISRRLKALQRDIAACHRAGGRARVRHAAQDGAVTVEVRLEQLKTSRVTVLDGVEFELLCRLRGVQEALAASPTLAPDPRREQE